MYSAFFGKLPSLASKFMNTMPENEKQNISLGFKSDTFVALALNIAFSEINAANVKCTNDIKLIILVNFGTPARNLNKG